ncbi:pneumococcal-type histidine triad protein [Streptococcus hongkongensis]
MKHKKLLGAGASLALIFGGAGYALGQYQAKHSNESAVAYVTGSKSDKNTKAHAVSNKTQDDINKEEGISAEQIVVKITDKGYVTSHGDHYHYYNGKVPYDSLISEELIMKDPNYVFNKSDVINEVSDGYIIKVDGKYYLYLKEGSKKKNIRTKEQIAKQAEKGSEEAKSNRKHSSYQSDLKQGFASKQAISLAKQDGRYTTDDGYIFNPGDVIEDTGDAFLVPHGNHFHYIPKSDLSASERNAAQAIWDSKHGKGQTGSQIAVAQPIVNHSGNIPSYGPVYQPMIPGQFLPSHPTVEVTPPNQSVKPQPGSKQVIPKGKIAYKDLLNQLYALPKNQRHQEDDGLLFDPNQVTKKIDRGYVIPHGDHWHVVPTSQLSALEIELADMHLSGQAYTDAPKESRPTVPKPVDTKPATKTIVLTDGSIVKTKQGKDGKVYNTSDGYHFNIDSILSYDKDGVTASHEGHEHYIPYSELEDSELKELEDAINKEGSKISKVTDSSYTKEELAKKLQYIALQNNLSVDQLKVTGDKVIIPHGNHSHTMELNDIPTKLTSDFFGSQEDYRDIIIQLKMSQAKMAYHTNDIIRDGRELVIYAEDGSTRRVALNAIKLPLDYDELDFSKEKSYRTADDDKLDYIARHYQVPRTRLMRIEHIVYTDGKPSVDLRLVNVNDPVLYTLKSGNAVNVDKKPEAPAIPKEEEKPADVADEKADVPAKEEVAEQEDEVEEVDHYDAKMAQIAKQYGLDKTTAQNRLIAISLKYNISIDQMTFGPNVSFQANGKNISFNLVTNQLVNP